MQRIPNVAAAWALAAVGAPLSAQALINGGFEQNPPALPGWSEIGGVTAAPSGAQGSANSARLGAAPGLSLSSGAYHGTTLWQRVHHGDPGSPCHFEFDYRADPSTTAWVEVSGPAGVYGAVLPPGLLFASVYVDYPACGDLEISFSALQAGASVTGLVQADNVLATPIGDVPAGAPLVLTARFLANPATALEMAMVELDRSRSGLAQKFTSPIGLVTADGNGVHGYILGSKPTVVWQQVESRLRGAMIPNVRALSFRRDLTTASNPLFAARTLDMDVVMAHSDVQRLGTNHAQNYVGAPTTVFARRQVSAPDWTQKPASGGAAPWDFRLPFDAPWTYNGTDDLLYQIDVFANSGAPYTAFENYPFDFESTPGSYTPSQNTGMAYGSGCATPGTSVGAFALTGTVYNHLIKLRYELKVTGAPPNAPVNLNLGMTKLGLPVPSLCTQVFASAELMLPMGIADPSGTINRFTIDNVPVAPLLVGKSLYGQALAPDQAQPLLPFSLSNGLDLLVPSNPTFPAVGRVYSYADAAGGALVTSGPWSGGIVALFEY